MSAEAMALVLNHGGQSGTAQLVLLGIANHDGDGGAWPSIATLARYAGVHPRNVQRAIDRLVQLGLIRVHVQAGGSRDLVDARRPNRYELLLRCPTDCDGSRHHRTRQYRQAPLLPYDAVSSTGGDSATPGASATRTPGASATRTPGASATRTTQGNQPDEETQVVTESAQRVGAVETVENPQPEPEPEPTTTGAGFAAFREARQQLAAVSS